VAGVVGLAPIADLEDFKRYTRCGPDIVADFLGGDAAPESPRFRLSDPATLAPVEARQLLLMGALDPIVPPAHGRHYAERVAAVGQDVEVVTVEGAGHFELVAPWTAPWSGVASRIVGFLEQVSGGDSR
jgi:pimeloyl-ACP methyl ester carboxylesterase